MKGARSSGGFRLSSMWNMAVEWGFLGARDRSPTDLNVNRAKFSSTWNVLGGPNNLIVDRPPYAFSQLIECARLVSSTWNNLRSEKLKPNRSKGVAGMKGST